MAAAKSIDGVDLEKMRVLQTYSLLLIHSQAKDMTVSRVMGLLFCWDFEVESGGGESRMWETKTGWQDRQRR